MTDAIRVSSPITGTEKTLSFEAGRLAQLADGAVLAQIGDTVLLATVAAARSVRDGIDFFPLTFHPKAPAALAISMTRWAAGLIKSACRRP